MPTLQELKNKWFIPMGGASPDGVPQRRHEGDVGNLVPNVSTDNNLVTALIDGQNYMERWRDHLVALAGAGAEFFHTGWRVDPVRTLGTASGATTSLADIIAANATGVASYVLACRNLIQFRGNRTSILTLRGGGVTTACLDNRFPALGSNHQKFAVQKSSTANAATIGSVDISFTRWDRQAHVTPEPERPPGNGATHDTGVLVEGEAVADIERCFRERWNDASRSFGMIPLLPSQPLITSPLAPGASMGPHSVQVLRTYGITTRIFGYSWFASGEFTVWASYLNAINRATDYIYIEDQYFLPFDWPPAFSRAAGDPGRNADIVYQLGEALKRGVDVIVLVPNNAEDPTHHWQKYQRDVGVNYLRAVSAGTASTFAISALHNSGVHVYVHSKLLIVDDEFVAMGSANIGRRSMTHDGEVHIGVVDATNVFAKDLRKKLWAEHTGRAEATLDSPTTAIVHWVADTAASTGHLHPYDLDTSAVYPAVPGSTSPPIGHPVWIRDRIDPYAGPPGLR